MRFVASALLSLVAISFAGSSANAGLFNRGCGCDPAPTCGCEIAAPSCGCEMSSCCDSGCGSRMGFLSRFRGRLNACCPTSCCEAAPSCCSAAPSCGCETVAPSCGCEASSCCDPCASACRPNILQNLRARLASRRACCVPSCCSAAPSCGSEIVAPSCGCN